jgi:hypothetical protein
VSVQFNLTTETTTLTEEHTKTYRALHVANQRLAAAVEEVNKANELFRDATMAFLKVHR